MLFQEANIIIGDIAAADIQHEYNELTNDLIAEGTCAFESKYWGADDETHYDVCVNPGEEVNNLDADTCVPTEDDVEQYDTINLGGERQFIDMRECAHDSISLDGTFMHCPAPPGFKTSLLPHQQSVLSAMLALEKDGKIKGQTHDAQEDLIHTFNTCAGYLSEKFGSGKTVMILALITASRMPSNRKIYQVCRYTPSSRNLAKSSYFIEKEYCEENILKPALLFVASSVVLQWKKAVKDFTGLKIFSVSGVYDLRRLYILIKNKTINEYDLVLVKNGNVTGKFDIDGYIEDVNHNRTQRKIYNIMANISRYLCWSRVIIDDYDIIKLPRPTPLISGLFTWFISATRAHISSTSCERPEHNTLHNILTYHNIDMRSLEASGHLTTTLNICNDEKYAEKSLSVGKPAFWAHVLVNENKRYVQMIGAMAGEKSYEIMEMLNGDAIGTAAEHAGIKSDNITDIFKKILQGQYDKYILSTNTLDWINALDIPGFEFLDEPNDDDVYHQKHVYAQRPIEYKYPDIKRKVLRVRDICVLDKNESGIAINRVKDNIKEGDCPVCCGDLNDDDAIIVKCCGKILCAECGIHGTNLTRYQGSIRGRCPNCRTQIGFTDLIFINSDFDLESIINEKPKGGSEITDTCGDAKTEEKKDKTKFDILQKIVLGKELPNKMRKNVIIPGMIMGINELPEAAPEHRKVIIFSKFDESLNDIEKRMTDVGIKYKRLGGTALQIHDIATEFQDSFNGTNILLINGEKYASGLNLQSATDLVFMHKIMSKAIESQIIGRIQRLGRKNKAHVHYILYDDEMPYMNFE